MSIAAVPFSSRWILLPTLLATLACGDDPLEADPDPWGRYELVRFNDLPLPATVVTPSDPCEVVVMEEGSLLLEADSTFDLDQSFQFTADCDAQPTLWGGTLSGTLVLNGNAISLEVANDEFFDFAGTVSGDAVELRPQIPATDQDAERFISYTFRR